MTERAVSRRGWPALVAALTLVVCASTGLGAGALTRSLVGQSTSTGLALTDSTSPQKPKPTNTAPAPSATTASASTVPAPAAFTLSVAITPNQLSPGQRFTVQAKVVGQDGVSPAQVLECSIRAPSNGVPPLFAQWPSPVVTDAAGLATWSLLAPQALPGRYAIEVIVHGPHQYYFYLDELVTLVAGTGGG